jgi:hypothetical protein
MGRRAEHRMAACLPMVVHGVDDHSQASIGFSAAPVAEFWRSLFWEEAPQWFGWRGLWP